MFIKTKPVVLDFQTGKPTQFSVSIVGTAPHKTYFVERIAGYTDNKQFAPGIVGELFRQEILMAAHSRLSKQYDPNTVSQMLAEGEGINIPEIPGVTAPGIWKNPRYSSINKEKVMRA